MMGTSLAPAHRPRRRVLLLARVMLLLSLLALGMLLWLIIVRWDDLWVTINAWIQQPIASPL